MDYFVFKGVVAPVSVDELLFEGLDPFAPQLFEMLFILAKALNLRLFGSFYFLSMVDHKLILIWLVVFSFYCVGAAQLWKFDLFAVVCLLVMLALSRCGISDNLFIGCSMQRFS